MASEKYHWTLVSSLYSKQFGDFFLVKELDLSANIYSCNKQKDYIRSDFKTDMGLYLNYQGNLSPDYICPI